MKTIMYVWCVCWCVSTEVGVLALKLSSKIDNAWKDGNEEEHINKNMKSKNALHYFLFSDG